MSNKKSKKADDHSTDALAYSNPRKTKSQHITEAINEVLSELDASDREFYESLGLNGPDVASLAEMLDVNVKDASPKKKPKKKTAKKKTGKSDYAKRRDKKRAAAQAAALSTASPWSVVQSQYGYGRSTNSFVGLSFGYEEERQEVTPLDRCNSLHSHLWQKVAEAVLDNDDKLPRGFALVLNHEEIERMWVESKTHYHGSFFLTNPSVMDEFSLSTEYGIVRIYASTTDKGRKILLGDK